MNHEGAPAFGAGAALLDRSLGEANLSVSRHTTYNLIGSLIPVVTALITVPLYIHLIGPARYGVLAIAWLLLGYFGLFDLGLGRATSFRVASLRDAPAAARADTFWAALGVNIGMGIVGGAVMWLSAGYFFAHVFKVSEGLRPEIVATVPLLALSVPVATLTGVLTGAMQGRERFLETNIVSVLSTGLFQLLPLLVAWKLGPNLVAILLAAMLAKLVAMLVLAYWCNREITRGHPPRIRRKEVPLLLRYGGWVTLTSVFGPLLVIVDRFAIGAMLGAVSVAVYTVPFQLAKQIQVLPSALTNALFPRISSASPEQQRKFGNDAAFALAGLISLPVLGGIFLLDPLLHLWVGRSIASDATPVGRILIVGFWINAFAMIPFTSLQARGRPDLVTKVLLAEIPPYFALLYFALVRWGVSGAAFALAARCLLDYFLLSWVSGKRFPGLLMLTCNFGLLVIAVLLSDLWGYKRWQWWVSASVLGIAMVILAWRTFPFEMKTRLLSQLRPAWSRAS
jgi:O-antigen/teichoic acid export membrane protein